MVNFLVETFLLGLRNLYLHKLRSLLTALGIIFGVAAVIAMLAIGEGSKQSAMEQMKQLGAKNVLIRSVAPPDSGQSTGSSQRVLDYGLTRSDLQRLDGLPHKVGIVAMRDTEQKVTRNGVRANANAIGTTPEAFSLINLPLNRGRYFTRVDYDRTEPVCVIGASVAKQLFPYQDPLGEHVQIGTSGFGSVMATVIGVLESSGLSGDGQKMVGRDLDDGVYFPLSLAQINFGDTIVHHDPGFFSRKQIELSEIWLQADEVENVEQMTSLAENVVNNAHKGILDYDIKAPVQLLRAAEKQTRMFNFILGGIAALALVVGGIGIMNIMLATVTERTREIGIRRALGAKRKHITLQFLIETTVISLAGGLIGVALGITLSILIEVGTRQLGTQTFRTTVTPISVFASFIISGFIGIGFGLYPAIKAAHMNPIEALRHA